MPEGTNVSFGEGVMTFCITNGIVLIASMNYCHGVFCKDLVETKDAKEAMVLSPVWHGVCW